MRSRLPDKRNARPGGGGPAAFHRFTVLHSWHPSQRITAVAGGSGDIEVQVTVDHLLDIQRWVLSWGRHAEVLDPPILRQEVVAELTALAAAYAERPAPPPA